jgi:uncharacterized damage-inducible protein DinB
MSTNLASQFRRWLEYEKDAHARVVESLRSVPVDRQGIAEYQKAVALLGHIAAARGVWLYRLGIAPKAPAQLFPEKPELAVVVADLRSIEAAWSEYLDKAQDADLSRTFEYQSLDAGRFRNRVEEILAQLFGHSSYHRGQIAMLVKAAGGKPAVTDFVYWCRESVPAGPA